MTAEKKDIVVLGAGEWRRGRDTLLNVLIVYRRGLLGVIGLTTALKIQETGRYNVTIVAEILPSDPKNIKYASQWAVSVILHLLSCSMRLITMSPATHPDLND